MAEPVVLINAFEVPAADAVAFIAAWCGARDYLRSQPGYIDTVLHQSMTPDADSVRQRRALADGRRLHRRNAKPRLPRVSRRPCQLPAAPRPLPACAHLTPPPSAIAFRA